MKKYLLERIYKREGDLPTAFIVHSLKYWNKYNQKIDYDCYVKIEDKLYQPIKLNNK